jgi:hypothetical protein
VPIPGADIVVQNDATGVATLTGDNGAFTIPVLPGGTYTVTVSLMDSKPARLKILRSTRPCLPRCASSSRLAVSETVTVTAVPVVRKRSHTTSTTTTANQVNSLPLVSRDAMNFITTCGVDTATTNRNSASTICRADRSHHH